MAADKCSGCQSFCMRGAQVVGQAPGKSTDKNYDSSSEPKANYTNLKKWQNWENITSGENGTTICSDNGLSASSQLQLVDYIKTAYGEGKFNPKDNNMFQKDQIKNKDKIANFNKLSTMNYNFSNSDAGIVSKDYETPGQQIQSNSIIHKEHYNGFLNQLAANNGNVVTSNDLPNNDKVSITSAEAGPQLALQQSGATVLKSVKGDSGNNTGDGDLITAQIYIDLAKQAKKLLYHPFQCNVCNVCEGGKFGEIVRELGTAIAAAGWGYSQKGSAGTISGTFGGVQGSFSLRRDCSGFVGACVSIYAKAEGKDINWVSCNSAQYVNGTFDGVSLFTEGPGDGSSTIFGYHEDTPEGNKGHVEATDENGNLWSGGGRGFCKQDCVEADIMMNATGGSKGSSYPALYHATDSSNLGGDTTGTTTLPEEGYDGACGMFNDKGQWCGASEVSTDDSGGCSNNETNFCGEGTICDRCEICLVCQSCMLVG